MKHDTQKPVERLRNKLSKLSRNQKLLIGGGTGAVVLLLLIIVIILIIGIGSANRQAAEFETKLGEYISKLDKTNKSISQLRPIVTSAPELDGNFFGGLSGDYKRAGAKQVALKIHQEEVFRHVPEFKQSDYLTELREHSELFIKNYNSYSPSERNFSKFILESDDVSLYKRASVRLSDTRSNIVFRKYKERLKELSVGAYAERGKNDLLARIDAAQKLEEQFRKNIEKADSFAEVRALNTRQLIELQQPRYDPIYGYAALTGIQASSFKLSSPAISSLEYLNKNMSAMSDQDAITTAYASLYGHVVSYNTPKSNATAPSNRESTGIVQYALSRLDTVLHDDKLTSEGELRDSIRSRLSSTYNAYASLPYGNDATNPPSAALKASTFYRDLTVDTSTYTGLVDVTRQLKETGTTGRSIKGAQVDIDAYNDYRRFAYSLYPTSILRSEVEAFKKANDACIDVRLEYTRTADKTIGLQFKEAQKAANIDKEVRKIQRDNDTSKTDRLNELRKQVQDSTAKVAELQQELEPAVKKQTEGIERCGPALKKANEDLASKTRDLPALYQSAKSSAEALYSNKSTV